MKRVLRRVLRYLFIRKFLLSEWLETRVAFNPIAGKMHKDPYPTYRRLREKDPVHRSKLIGGWVVSRYSDVDAVLRDHRRFGKNDVDDEGRPVAPTDGEVRSMLYLDPPDHTRLRSLVSKAFTPRSIEAMRLHIEQTVDGLLDEVENSESFDVIETLAHPLPVIVIAEMLGVPTEDREKFKAWSDDIALTVEIGRTEQERMRALKSRDELWEYFGAIIEERRREPKSDLISALNAAEDEGDKLSREEMLATLVLLLVAGNETSRNLIGNGLLALLRHPDQMERLRSNPDLIEPAVEELLRFDSPVQMDSRKVLEDMAFGGKQLSKGETLLLLIGAANRDPDVFADPDRVVLGRADTSHISFGRGIHHCLGAPLARAEGQIVLRKLLERYSDIKPVGKPRFRDFVVLRGLTSLRVKVKRAARARGSAEARAGVPTTL